jgi:peptide deformylase
MLEIVKFPNDILRQKMSDFNFKNPIIDPKQLEKDMLETMFSNNGMGLAANQVGVPVRMFVMGHTQFKDHAQGFFNPIIVANSEIVHDLEESCLSFPGIYANIKRPSAIKARWQNSLGDWEEGEFSGYECKCFLHEYDHLEGLVFKDRVSELKWALAVKKSKPKKRRK